MKKLSLLLSVVLFSSAALFAGDDKKEKKAEACKKESSCCAKKTAKEGDKPAEAHTAGKSQRLKTDHKLKQVAASELNTTPAKAEASAKSR
ncbi:MAG: hypothetical protein JNM21_06570 [Taibaiella sp.]|nr:hypothetical protein [Taibaiella sp.]